MTQASDFTAFLDLKEITGATDDQLASMLARGCSDLALANFEDGMTEVLLRFLRHLTGIPWVRAYQEGARPSLLETSAPDGQYGILWLLNIKPIGAATISYGLVLDPVTGLEKPDMCETIQQRMRYSFQMDVYRDAGQSNRQQENDILQAPVGSAIDVLIRAALAMKHPRSRRALQQYCIGYGEHPVTDILNLPQPLVQNSFETRAHAMLEIFAAPISAMRAPAFGEVEVAMSCPESPLLGV